LGTKTNDNANTYHYTYKSEDDESLAIYFANDRRGLLPKEGPAKALKISFKSGINVLPVSAHWIEPGFGLF